MKPQSVQVAFYALNGGLDLMTPAIAMPPGRVFDAQNYEPALAGGYRRIDGFERFDGRTSPSDAAYWVIAVNTSGALTVGATLAGVVSGATGKILASTSGQVVLGRVSGTFVRGENLTIGGVAVGIAASTAGMNGAASPFDDADYTALAADDRRADIQKIPGSGRIRGVWVYNDVVYAFRDNAGATAGTMWKSTTGGWTQVTFGRELGFVARSGTVTMTIATPGVMTFTGHGFANDQAVVFTTTGALPTGLVAGTTYYVVATAANTFEVSATVGGAAINTSGAQSGTHTVTLTGSAISVGNTVTGVTSGASGVVKASLLRTGTWGAAPVGTLVFASVTGAFTSGEALRVSGQAKVQASGADTAITRAAGGSMEFVNANFTGSAATTKMYGVDGVNPAFEFDGTTYVPIHSGMSTDTPSHITFHKQYLWLAFLGSLQFSGLGNPYAWSPLVGAGEIGMGDAITGLMPVAGNIQGAALAVFTTHKTSMLYGSSSSNFVLIPSVYDIGFASGTIQQASNDTYGLSPRGMRSLQTTQQYGDFLFASVTLLIEPLMLQKAMLACASITLKLKNQYRLYFTDGTAIAIALSGAVPSQDDQTMRPVMVLNYGMPVRCIVNSTLSTGEEVTFFGSDDGYVYQDNSGTSFDGEEIEAWIRAVFNNLKTPMERKRFRRAVVEVHPEGFASVNVRYDLGYGSYLVTPPAVAVDTQIAGTGSYWDQATWDAYVWDSPVVSSAEVSLDGTDRNIAFTFYSSRAQDKPHTVQGISLVFTPRRIERELS